MKLGLALIAIAPFSVNAQTAKKLSTGLYEIVPKSAYGFKDPLGGKTIFVEPKTAVTIKHCTELIKDYDASDASPLIGVKLDSTGAVMLKKLSARYIGKEMAIIAGNQLISTPRIIATLTTGYFPISNHFTNAETDRLKLQLHAEMEAAKQVPVKAVK
jgi:preprotein translocase subunit SecD